MLSRLRKHSRLTLSLIEMWLGFYLFINSLIPLLHSGYDRSNYDSFIQYFLNGNGIITSGFWIRILAIVVGVGMIILPFFGDKYLLTRTRLNYLAFVLFTYVGILVTIYLPIDYYLWIGPLVAGLLAASVYLGNKAELRHHNAG